MYFNVNFNVFFKLIKLHLLVNELYMIVNFYIHQIITTWNVKDGTEKLHISEQMPSIFINFEW